MIRLLAILALLMPGVVFSQTVLVWQCGPAGTLSTAETSGAQVAPSNSLVIDISPTNLGANGGGTCLLASSQPSSSFTRVQTTTGSTVTYTWVTLASLGLGAASASTPAPAPVATNNGTALLTWTAPTLNTDGSAITLPLTYNVYRGTSATALTVLNTSATLNFQDSGLTAGSTYFYAVTAVAGGIESAQSATVSTTTAAPAPVIKTPAAPGLPVVISPAPIQP